MPRSEAREEAVPHHLRQDAGAGHGVAPRVGVNDGAVLQRQVLHRKTVHEEQVIRPAKPRRRPANGEGGRHGDVQPVDLPHTRGAESEGDRPSSYGWREALTIRGTQLLGVSDPRDRPLAGGHDDHTCDNGARQWAAPYLIGTRYVLKSRRSEILLYATPARHV
jgi:hypothetical protein